MMFVRPFQRSTMFLSRFFLAVLLSVTLFSNQFSISSVGGVSAAEQEYPVALNPFHIEYIMVDGSGELPVNDLLLLSATRSFLSYMLSQDKQEFVRVLLYHFVRSQENSTIVSYSGSAFFTSVGEPTFSSEIYNATYESFLGHNQMRYKSWLSTKGIQIESARLTTADGEPIEYIDGEIVFPATSLPNPGNADGFLMGVTRDGGHDDVYDAYDDGYEPYTGEPRQIDPQLSRMIYLFATLVPLSLLLVLAGWWLLRRMRNNVEWGGNQKADPKGDIWKTNRRLADLVFDDATIAPTNTSVSEGTKGGNKNNRDREREKSYHTEVQNVEV